MFERECSCLGENTEKFKTVLIKKEKRISKNEEKLQKPYLAN